MVLIRKNGYLPTEIWYHCGVVQGRELLKVLSSLQQERTFAKGVKAAKGTQAFQG